MIGPTLPQSIVAAHPMIANQHVHQHLLEGVPHVQRSCDIGWRQLDAIRDGARRVRRLEPAARFPQRIPLRLDRVRLETFGEFHQLRDAAWPQKTVNYIASIAASDRRRSTLRPIAQDNASSLSISVANSVGVSA